MSARRAASPVRWHGLASRSTQSATAITRYARCCISASVGPPIAATVPIGTGRARHPPFLLSFDLLCPRGCPSVDPSVGRGGVTLPRPQIGNAVFQNPVPLTRHIPIEQRRDPTSPPRVVLVPLAIPGGPANTPPVAASRPPAPRLPTPGLAVQTVAAWCGAVCGHAGRRPPAAFLPGLVVVRRA